LRVEGEAVYVSGYSVSVRSPVLAERAEIMVKAAIFLEHENDVINRGQTQTLVEGCSNRRRALQSQGAGLCAAASASPSSKGRTRRRCCCELHGAPVIECCATDSPAIDSGGSARHHTGTSSSERDRNLVNG
jgi:hypothetical protein